MRSRSSSAAMGGGRGEILDLIRSDSESEEGEFFDANEDWEEGEPSSGRTPLVRWNSQEMELADSGFLEVGPGGDRCLSALGAHPSDGSKVGLLILVFHGGSVLDTTYSLSGLPLHFLPASLMQG